MHAHIHKQYVNALPRGSNAREVSPRELLIHEPLLKQSWIQIGCKGEGKTSGKWEKSVYGELWNPLEENHGWTCRLRSILEWRTPLLGRRFARIEGIQASDLGYWECWQKGASTNLREARLSDKKGSQSCWLRGSRRSLCAGRGSKKEMSLKGRRRRLTVWKQGRGQIWLGTSRTPTGGWA